MSAIQPPKNCGLYKPGHMTHWIQARKGWEDQVNLPLPGRLLSTSADGTVVIEVNGVELHLWNHLPERLAATAAYTHGAVAYQASWHLLLVGGSNCCALFSVATANDVRVPCPTTPPPTLRRS